MQLSFFTVEICCQTGLKVIEGNGKGDEFDRDKIELILCKAIKMDEHRESIIEDNYAECLTQDLRSLSSKIAAETIGQLVIAEV
jgi:transcriptional regulator NrdR family protein